jgi:hypothetical protein
MRGGQQRVAKKALLFAEAFLQFFLITALSMFTWISAFPELLPARVICIWPAVALAFTAALRQKAAE